MHVTNPTLLLAGINGAIAVAASAVAAHALKSKLPAQQMAWFTQAAEFQLWHALALLGLAALPASALTQPTLIVFQAGILFFSGTLYWLALNGSGSLGPLHWLTPIGGLALIGGWVMLALSAFRAQA